MAISAFTLGLMALNIGIFWQEVVVSLLFVYVVNTLVLLSNAATLPQYEMWFIQPLFGGIMGISGVMMSARILKLGPMISVFRGEWHVTITSIISLLAIAASSVAFEVYGMYIGVLFVALGVFVVVSMFIVMNWAHMEPKRKGPHVFKNRDQLYTFVSWWVILMLLYMAGQTFYYVPAITNHIFRTIILQSISTGMVVVATVVCAIIVLPLSSVQLSEYLKTKQNAKQSA